MMDKDMKELDEKMKHNFRLRWFYRWEYLKLSIGEWWWKYFKTRENTG